MKYISAIIISVILFCTCSKTPDNSSNNSVIVRLDTHILTKQELDEALPTGLTSEDSIIIAENFIAKWCKDALMYDLAKNNINDMKEINQLVENYKKSLITYQYQEQLISEKMSSVITEADIKKYYEENKDKFKLEATLIKGLFLKIPVDAPQINKIKEWYKSPSVKDLENIEKYSIQNAVNYDYFYNRWIRWDDIIACFPSQNQYSDALLHQQKQIEAQDSAFCYLLNVKEVLFAGNNEPYEHAKNYIKDMIINQKRVDFLKKFEDDLYQTALEKGFIKRVVN